MEAILAMGRSMGLVTVGEGVESAEQWEWLSAPGCDLGQGFVWSRPVALEAVRLLLSGPLGERPSALAAGAVGA